MSGSQDEVKLIAGWFSLNVFRVELALKLKGIPYESLEEDFPKKSSLLLELNPVHNQIPVLVHNGKPICESLLILEYIDEIWEHNPILPQHPYDKAMARFWAKFVEEKFTAAVKGIYIAVDEEERQKGVEKAIEALKVLEQELEKKGSPKFFGGDNVGIVDIALSFFNNWLVAVEEAASIKIYNSGTFPLIDKWNQNLIELPFVKESLPIQDKLNAYLSGLRLKITSK